MKKIVLLKIFIALTFVLKSQESIIVYGHLNRSSVDVSQNFKKNLFCYLKGGFITSFRNRFHTFRVDSVINGSFKGISNKDLCAPFNINIGLINECTILELNKNYRLKIKQIQNTNYYYIDSLALVSPNEAYLEKLSNFNDDFKKNIDILTKGSLQERRDLLSKLQKYPYIHKQLDYRYIPYLIPYISKNDSITNYSVLHWDGEDENGNMIGGSDIFEEKGVYSDYLYSYLSTIMLHELPPKSTDSTGWHLWFDNLFSGKCFQPVNYCKSDFKNILSKPYINYFLTDTINNVYYLGTEKGGYTLDKNNGHLNKQKLHKDYQRHYYSKNSLHNNETTFYNSYFKGIELFEIKDSVFCKVKNKLIPIDLSHRKSASSSYTYPHLIIHNDENFLILSSQNPDGHNCLKAGVISRTGTWIIEPKNIYKKEHKSYIGNTDDIGSLSYCYTAENNIVFSFSDRTFERKSYSANEKYSDAIIVCKADKNLEKIDSAVYTIDFPRFDYRFTKTWLLENNNTILLLGKVTSNDKHQLFYKLLNKDLKPKTDFIKLADDFEYGVRGNPILTSEGFGVCWVDNDISENVLRSVLINDSGEQSKIINISNHKIDGIYHMELDQNYVDIYLLNKNEKTFFRKRISKKEYK